MKKAIVLLLALCMCIYLCACTGTTNENSLSQNNSTVESTNIAESSVDDSSETPREPSEVKCTEHSYNDATCTAPKICKTCGKTEGDALGHDYIEATCISPKICKVCEATDGDALGHDWSEATCASPKTCKTCGETDGEVAHNWVNATCKAPKTCGVCGITDGNVADHAWTNATCKAPKTCGVCGLTEGTTLEHSWAKATCTTAKTCKSCLKTEGSALGHNWTNATCKAPKTCKTCGKTEGAKAAHSYKEGVCSVCGAKDPNYVKVYKAGETWKVSGEWEFTLNNVTEHILCSSNRNENYGFAGMHGIMISYTYKNLSSSELKINWNTFGTISVYDSQSEKGEEYGEGIFCDHEKDAVDCMPNTKATAKHSYALNNKSTTVTIYVSRKASNGVTHTATFKVSITPLPNEPEEDKLDGYKITCDTSLPKTINYYNYSNSINSSCQVTAVSFEVSGDDLYIYMTGKKTYDSKGSGQSSACKIGWKLYNSQNYVVDDGTLYTNSLAVGEGFLNAKDSAYDVLVPGETYRLVIMNVN
ncbi:MAG: hypothetical protein UFP03_05970 [Paludibacteraceae bacterium]|nr:hypothetical protein [Paludibacteraceae bacterium]